MSKTDIRRRNPQSQAATTEKDVPMKKDEEEEEEIEPKPKKTDVQAANEKFSKFFTRTFWGLLMVAFFGIIIALGHTVISLFVILLQIIVFKEMIALRYKEAKERQIWGFRTLHYYFLFITCFYVYGIPLIDLSVRLLPASQLFALRKYHLLASFVLYIVGFITFIATLKRGMLKYQFGQLTWTLMTLLLVVGQSNFIIQNTWKGIFWFIFPCSLIICNDVMAYMCGMVVGRKFIDRPLTPLSPNKTWEGFVGALFCTLAWAFVFSGFLANYDFFICPKELSWDFTVGVPHCTPNPVFLPKTYQLPITIVSLLQQIGYHITDVTVLPIQLHSFVFALFASLIAPFGGFFASGIKRAYRIKDFDSLFPGHGGMTDRMDCQFIMGLFTYVYFTAIIASYSMDVKDILLHVSALSTPEQLQLYNHLKQILGK